MEEEEHSAITRNKFEDILSLFDLYWFHHLILFSHLSPIIPPQSLPPALPEVSTEAISPVPSPLHHRRAHSDESISTFLPRPHQVKLPTLQTILSGKESMNPTPSSRRNSMDMNAVWRKRQTKAQMRRRSISELEVEELKGLMDLGFNFSDDEVERDPRIADIVPGLRKRSEGEGEVEVARRPYLSEAWRFRDEDERRRVLRDWRVLANGDEGQVKDQLRRWAHAVASTVQGHEKKNKIGCVWLSKNKEEGRRNKEECTIKY